ncbi:MAG: zf-HC2 domain-containing protein [Lachnospiraceae bacterium]|nr:zf-HC2 domain-containing protein [Lachnospiraceae bacterium]
MNCNLFRDLIPVYLENLCSAETKRQMEEHVTHCPECRKELEDARTGITLKTESKWEESIDPLKKVKRKIKRKNGMLCLLGSVLLILIILTAFLAYGQLTHRGISFETLYERIHFDHVGREFARGNLDPFYDELWDPYFETCDRMLIIREAYPNAEEYQNAMKQAMAEKWNEFFKEDGLRYLGISSIGYISKNGEGGVLTVGLRFLTKSGWEYRIGLEKEKSGKWQAWDYSNDWELKDSVFACLSNHEQDEKEIARQWVHIKGERALVGDDEPARMGNQCERIVSEKELRGEADDFSQKLREHLQEMMEEGFYPTDLTENPIGYDKDRHLYRYQLTLELTSKVTGERKLILWECLRVKDSYVYVEGTEMMALAGFEEELK